jgi:hypothetical protein
MTGLGADGRLTARFTENRDSKTTPSIMGSKVSDMTKALSPVAGTPDLFSGSLRLRVRSGETHRCRGVESYRVQSPG